MPFRCSFGRRFAAAGLRLTEIPVRLIYNDPNRHFGGSLDDAGNRLRHYLDVLNAEVSRLAENPLCPFPNPRQTRICVCANNQASA